MEHNAILDSKLSLSSNIPLYAQLVGIIKREISSGALKIGDLLPSEAELCRALDISRNTARQAIGELEDEGLVVRKRGKGTFVVEKPGQIEDPLGFAERFGSPLQCSVGAAPGRWTYRLGAC